MNYFDIFIYLAMIITLIAALYLENKDLFWWDGYDNYSSGNGAAYSLGKPCKHDNVNSLLKKIKISSRYDESSVYWRRVIIFTILLTFFVLFLVLQRLPTGLEVLISFVVIYFFTFIFLVLFQEVVSKPATKQVDKAVRMIRNKLNYNN